jgi:hypothetical protein
MKAQVAIRSLAGGALRAISSDPWVRPYFGPVMGGRSGSTIHNPWSDVRVIHPSPNGRALVLIDRRIATADDTASFGVQWLDAAGSLRLECRYRYRPERITERGIDSTASYLARTYGMGLLDIVPGSADEAAFAKNIRAALRAPRYSPFIIDARVGNDESLLLRRSGAAGRHVLIAGDGRPLGLLRIPEDTLRRTDGMIYTVTADAVWLRRPDENDVPDLVRYRIMTNR